MANEKRAEGWELTPEDENYPSSLRDMEHPPERIYGVGSQQILSSACLAIVGARRPTPYGSAVAAMAGRIAAESGITVVSGGALGCDSAAARSALNTGGKTIVVSGVGADQVYPPSSKDVFKRAVKEGGAVVSLVPWGTPPQIWSFPKRNEIIAALSTAILVCEAGERSGTASTAMAGIDIGREVYAFPGSIFSPESRGSNNLIRDGATIIASEEDLETVVSREYGVLRLVREEVATPRSRLMSALIASPMRAGELADKLGMEPVEMMRILSDYEIAGVVRHLPDGRYAPTQEVLLGQGRMEV